MFSVYVVVAYVGGVSFSDLCQVASGHLAHQHYEEGEEGEVPSSKRRKTAVRVERPRGVAPHFRPADTTDIQEVGSKWGRGCAEEAHCVVAW